MVKDVRESLRGKRPCPHHGYVTLKEGEGWRCVQCKRLVE